MRKLVIIPTYNEKENISAMIDKVFSLPETFEMLVIDDGSQQSSKSASRNSPRRCTCWNAAASRGWARPI
jgi:hypothetical protein